MRPVSTLLVAACLLSCAALPAQDRKPENPSLVIASAIENVLAPEVITRLRSRDLRTVAWGGYLAGQYRLVSARQQLLHRLVALADTDKRERRFAVGAILDALIRTGAVVDAKLLVPHMRGSHLAPCLILMARDPRNNAGRFLDLYREHDAEGRRTLWLLAGNVLAGQKTDGFAPLLLGALRQTLRVSVADDEAGLALGGRSGRLGGRRGVGRVDVPPGNPPTVMYEITEQGRTGDTLLAAGPVPIYHRRREHTALRFGLGGGEGIDLDGRQEIRIDWLATMLGTRARWLGYTSNASTSVIWKDAASYRNAVAAARDRLVVKFVKLRERCVAAGLLDEETAATLSADVRIEVTDTRAEGSATLPAIGR